ncbi:MAG: hypothetical protein QW590_01810 [Candidatus Bilamarchaeaceae archaeon]
MSGEYVLIEAVSARFVQLVEAPLSDPQMLWSAVPLVIATLFMTLYFGKYKQEELGWNTAFGNTMVFLFMALNLIRQMYYADGVGSWDNVLSNNFYLSVSIALTVVALVLMLITYYHLLPRKVAFFLFSAPPINVSVYVLMTIIYTGVPADYITLLAALILFFIIFIILKLIQTLERAASKPEGLSFMPEETKEERFLRKLKEKNIQLEKLRKRGGTQGTDS